MFATIKVHKGLDIQLLGKAEKKVVEIFPETVASKPLDFVGLFPKVLVQEGDEVLAGTPLYFDKHREEVKFTSPVSGRVKEIRRGPKRVLEEIVIEAGRVIDYLDFGKADPNDLTRDEIVGKMLKSGTWPYIRQRPFSVIARPADQPKAIFISAFDTNPLAPDFGFITGSYVREFQTGLDVIGKLTTGKVHLNIAENDSPGIFTDAKGVQINRFSGPHPTGNVSTQISRLDPINKGDIVWYLRPQEVVMIGRLFLTGRYDAAKTYALTGPMVKNPVYVKTIAGASIQDLLQGNTREGKCRYISGSVLTGTGIAENGFPGFYDSQITLIPEGDYHEFLGWAKPGLTKYSFYNQFLSSLIPRKAYNLDTNLHGSERAFVMTGKYEKVFPFDIYPMQLLKAILAEDIELMENLGIYEIDEEDFALVEFIDTSKMEIQSIVRKGLELMRKETT